MEGFEIRRIWLPRAPAQIGTAFQKNQEDQMMNNDILEGKWKQIRGEAKAWWGKLTDDDLERAGGKLDVFTGLLQEKYGYTHQRAVDEVDKRVTDYEANLKKKVVPTYDN
jgi:uncharacterized protein YjbJ (UPF0337 family)